MTDTPTPRYGGRQQSQGSNTNTWGDDKLNELFRLFDRGSKGVQSLAITGDTVLSWTNYIATNDGQVAVLTLTGSLSSPAALTVPSREWVWDVIKNFTGQTVTVKTSGGVGVAIGNGKFMEVHCDGVDCYNGTGTVLPGAATVAGALTVAGQISGVVTGTALTDAANVGQVAAAIATASLPATAGTVLNSITDTTAGYLGAKIAVSGDLVLTTQTPAGAEKALITATPYWNAPRALAFSDSPIAALDRDVLLLNTSSGAITVNMPAAGRVTVVDSSGNAATNIVTLVPAGADTITFNIIDSAYFGAAWRRNGTNWDLA